VPIVTASSRGQIVIPKDIRKKLEISPGRKLLIKIRNDEAVIVPLPEDPVEYFCGFFEGKQSLTKALLDERRKDRSREEEKAAG
jgi:AbrB family looped-hinge helix DNA binding protein